MATDTKLTEALLDNDNFVEGVIETVCAYSQDCELTETEIELEVYKSAERLTQFIITQVRMAAVL